jgi:hypothetical protein
VEPVLDLSITVDGDRVVIEGLGRLQQGKLLDAAILGIENAAIGIHREAFKNLSGAGAKGTSKQTTSKSRKSYLKWEKQTVAAGGYPVPVRTGNLRRLLDWLKPGESKSGPAGTFKAGQAEVIIYDSAIYAGVIHEGRGSSAKFGPRRFLIDALGKFNQDNAIKASIEKEIQKAKEQAGL